MNNADREEILALLDSALEELVSDDLKAIRANIYRGGLTSLTVDTYHGSEAIALFFEALAGDLPITDAYLFAYVDQKMFLHSYTVWEPTMATPRNLAVMVSMKIN